MAQVAGDALELELTVDLRRTEAHRFGAAVRVSGDGRGARVWYQPAGNRIGVDRLLGPEQVYGNPAANQRGDLQGSAEKLQAPQVTAPAGTVHGKAGTVTLRIFVDRSILEVYCGGAALTDRLYPDAFGHRRRPVRRGRSGARQHRLLVATARHLVIKEAPRVAQAARAGEPIAP